MSRKSFHHHLSGFGIVDRHPFHVRILVTGLFRDPKQQKHLISISDNAGVENTYHLKIRA
jgi:hypothetical protein